MNVLILSCGTRNKIVQYFRKELGDKGIVVVVDCSDLAPALYDADKFFVIPSMDEDGYCHVVLSICKRYNIDVILSLVDPELNFLAEHKNDFISIGTVPIVPDLEVVEMCFDKYKTYKFLIENGFRAARSYLDKEAFYKDIELGLIDYPVFVKPKKGSASININKIDSRKEIELLFDRFNDLLIQEYMDGIEYGADVYIDMKIGRAHV